MTVDANRYCTFRLADLYIGIEVMRVQEVLRAQPTTPIPLTTSVVGGLMNLRGEIVTTLDLRRRLDLPAMDDGTEPMNVVIRTDDGVLSLLVDRIGDVLELDADGFEPAPPTLRGVSRELVSAVHKLDGQLLLVLDLGRLLALTAA